MFPLFKISSLARIAQKVSTTKKKLSIANRYARVKERVKEICIKNDKATKEAREMSAKINCESF
jgi:hypothetical protein